MPAGTRGPPDAPRQGFRSNFPGELALEGPYRWSRNPQYVGDVAATVGWAALTGSARVGLGGLVAVVWYLLLPLAEEPWLGERFAEAYRRCRERGPRFF